MDDYPHALSAPSAPGASRRDIVASTDTGITEASSVDQSLAEAVEENLQLEKLLERDAAGETPEMLLKHMLSIRSVVSTGSSFAQRQQAAIGTKASFREIGTGSIGKVYEHPGTVFVYKVPVSGQPDKLWNNYEKHLRVYNSFKAVPYVRDQIEIPRCFWYATPDTATFWDEYLERFPDTLQFPRAPRHVLCMERIFPLPCPIRHSLVDKFCPVMNRQQMKESEANKDCLVRPCLGRQRYGSGSHFFTLRNFKLHANEIQDLGMPTSQLCSNMAHTLAVVHWRTKIDAMDVESVLGSSPLDEQEVRVEVDTLELGTMAPHTSTYEQATHSSPNFTKRVTALWLIDFDDYSNITMDSHGVDMAVKAFLDTNWLLSKAQHGQCVH